MYQALTGRYLEEREPRMQTLMEKKSLTAEDGKGIFNRGIAFPRPPRVSCPTRDDRVAMCGRGIRGMDRKGTKKKVNREISEPREMGKSGTKPAGYG